MGNKLETMSTTSRNSTIRQPFNLQNNYFRQPDPAQFYFRRNSLRSGQCSQSEVTTTVLHKPAADIIRKIPLSNSSVQRRIDEMAEHIEESLCNHLKTSKFSIQLDESTLPTNLQIEDYILINYFLQFLKDFLYKKPYWITQN